jgi:hypothetical protein
MNTPALDAFKELNIEPILETSEEEAVQQIIKSWKTLREDNQSLRRELSIMDNQLKLMNYTGNLISIIHGDGGYYIAANGWKRATDDAIRKYFELRDKSESEED